jgi:hypothetical protein
VSRNTDLYGEERIPAPVAGKAAHGPALGQYQPIVAKKDPKLCTQCKTIETRHVCKECDAVVCALCLPLSNICTNCLGSLSA